MSSNFAAFGSLAQKTALVTGGTTGIGFAAAELFHAAGARIAITGINESTLAAARKRLPDDALVVRSDASQADDQRHLVRKLTEHLGGLDVVFLNAGIAGLRAFEQTDEEMYQSHMDINVKGVFFTLRALLPLLRDGASVIVNTSVAGLKAAPHMAAYSASKGAVSALVRTLAVELSTRRIQVNALAPAMIRTPIQEKFGLPPQIQAAAESDAVNRIPLGRFGEAAEVAAAALFLASPSSSFITGAEIPVDGGWMVA